MSFFKRFFNTISDFELELVLQLEGNIAHTKLLDEQIRNLSMRVLFLEQAYNAQGKQIMELIQCIQKKKTLLLILNDKKITMVEFSKRKRRRIHFT